MDDRATASKANGFHTLVNTIASPGEAFEALRVAPTWGLAFLVTVVLVLIGFALFFPAYTHIAVRHAIETPSSQATVSAAQRQRTLNFIAHPPALYVAAIASVFAVTILISALLNTVILLIPNALANGTADFKRLWCGSMNILVPSFGLYFIVLGVIAAIRGPDAFNSQSDLYSAVPGLSWLSPSAHGFMGIALTSVSVFTLWGLALNIIMMRRLAGLRAGVAWVFPVIITLLGAVYAGVSSLFHTE